MNAAPEEAPVTRPSMGPILGTIFALAVLISLAALALVGFNFYQDGGSGLAELYSRAIVGADLPDRALRASLMPLTFMALWALCMVVFTLARSAATPKVTSTTFALWLVSGLVAPLTLGEDPEAVLAMLTV